MDNDTTQPFQPAPFPTFTDQGGNPTQAASPAASEQPTRRRKSRRSNATPAASSPTSSAARPKRKYTRRTPPAPSRKPVEVPATPFAELEFVTETVATLRALDPKTRARVMTAIGRLVA